MKIGLRMSKRLGDLGEIAQWAAEIGIASIDLLAPDSDSVAVLERHGLALGSVDAAGSKNLLSPDPSEQQAGIEAAQARIAQVAEVGGRVLFEVLAPPDPAQPRADSFEIWKDTYPAVVAAAEEHGIQIAVEPFPGPPQAMSNLGANPDVLRRMFEAIPSPALGLCYDPSHFVRLGIDPIRLLQEFRDRIHWVHAKDCKILADGLYDFGYAGETFGRRYKNSGGYWRYCIPGRGDIDWTELVFELSVVDPDAVLSIELEDHQYAKPLDRRKRAVALAVEYLAGLL